MPLFYSPGWFSAGSTVKLEVPTNSVTFNASTLADVTSPITALRVKAGGDTAFLVENQAATTQSVVGANAGGTYIGSVNNVSVTFRQNNTARWIINTSGHFIPNTDVAVDIGITGTNRVRSIFAQNFTANATQIGFYGIGPVTRSAGWTITNDVTDRTFDANAGSVLELADVVATLIRDLAATGIIGDVA